VVYRELAPPPDLAAHVACVWTSVASGGVIFPDGCADIVWAGRLIVAGPATRPADAHVAPGTPVFGVRFRLGAAGASLGLPAEALRDCSAPLDALWRVDEERVAEGGLPALLALVRARRGGVDPLVRAAALRLAGEVRGDAAWSRGGDPGREARGGGAGRAVRGDARPGREVRPAGVHALADDLGISERQLRRRFADAVGYGPKTLTRVLRFQRFLELAGEDLARAALDAGYADQAHLTRECRRLAGRTPAQLAASRPAPAGERVRFVQAAAARAA